MTYTSLRIRHELLTFSFKKKRGKDRYCKYLRVCTVLLGTKYLNQKFTEISHEQNFSFGLGSRILSEVLWVQINKHFFEFKYFLDLNLKLFTIVIPFRNVFEMTMLYLIYTDTPGHYNSREILFRHLKVKTPKKKKRKNQKRRFCVTNWTRLSRDDRVSWSLKFFLEVKQIYTTETNIYDVFEPVKQTIFPVNRLHHSSPTLRQIQDVPRRSQWKGFIILLRYIRFSTGSRISFQRFTMYRVRPSV